MAEVSERTRQAAAKRLRLVDELEAAQHELQEAIIEDAKRGVPQIEIAEATSYRREHIRRIERAGGVQGRK